jgi:cysteine desulfurase
MLPLLTEHFGNPSSANAPGRRARLALDDARDQMAEGLGCIPGEVVFCAGGTEAANLAVMGTVAAARAARAARAGVGRSGDRFVCSAIEHHSVLRSVESLGGTTVAVRSDGVVDLDALAATLSSADGVAGVAVMLANNEVGTIQPIADVAQVVRRRAPGAVLVVDAVHAVPWLDVAQVCDEADILFVSAHKFGGPKGVGALVLRARTPWLATALGGAQERGRRPGTENVAAIAAMAAALSATVRARSETVCRVAAMRDRLADGLLAALRGVQETCVAPTTPPGDDFADRHDRNNKVAGSCHLLVEGRVRLRSVRAEPRARSDRCRVEPHKDCRTATVARAHHDRARDRPRPARRAQGRGAPEELQLTCRSLPSQ